MATGKLISWVHETSPRKHKIWAYEESTQYEFTKKAHHFGRQNNTKNLYIKGKQGRLQSG
jgi:hypothetical protein